jgi:hypothetical protein
LDTENAVAVEEHNVVVAAVVVEVRKMLDLCMVVYMQKDQENLRNSTTYLKEKKCHTGQVY